MELTINEQKRIARLHLGSLRGLKDVRVVRMNPETVQISWTHVLPRWGYSAGEHVDQYVGISTQPWEETK